MYIYKLTIIILYRKFNKNQTIININNIQHFFNLYIVYILDKLLLTIDLWYEFTNSLTIIHLQLNNAHSHTKTHTHTRTFAHKNAHPHRHIYMYTYTSSHLYSNENIHTYTHTNTTWTHTYIIRRILTILTCIRHIQHTTYI